MDKREFDHYADSYDALLADPIRDRFTGAASDFFHRRKRDLIRQVFRRTSGTRQWSYLDLGCGKGELLGMLAGDFAEVVGTDPAAGMMNAIQGVTTRVQDDPAKIPFEERRFDFVTAVCVYHHVPPAERAALTREVRRVLKPGGRFSIIEHNPWNPVTRLIVSRTPVDENAILLPAAETRHLLRDSGFEIEHQEFFLYLPEKLYRHLGFVEAALAKVPFGGQYAVFGKLRG